MSTFFLFLLNRARVCVCVSVCLLLFHFKKFDERKILAFDNACNFQIWRTIVELNVVVCVFVCLCSFSFHIVQLSVCLIIVLYIILLQYYLIPKFNVSTENICVCHVILCILPKTKSTIWKCKLAVVVGAIAVVHVFFFFFFFFTLMIIFFSFVFLVCLCVESGNWCVRKMEWTGNKSAQHKTAQ